MSEKTLTRFISIAPQFVVPDVVKAAEYYRDVLGFTIIDYFLDPPVYAMVHRNGIQIHFGKADTTEFVPNVKLRRMSVDAYIRVDDVETLFAEFKARNAEVIEGPVTRVYGMREINVRDCYGYILAFGQG